MIDYRSKVVELSVDVPAMWKLQCRNLYNNKNLGALAVRECIQNSIDSIQTAIRNKEIKKGHIDVTITGNNLYVTDNGCGMDVRTLHEKFLTLGGTTKGDSDNVGGFGLAKSVILGCGETFQVETRDNRFSSADLGKRPIQRVSFRQGTKISMFNVTAGNNALISDTGHRFKDAVCDYVYSSRIPKDITVTINGEKHDSYFQATSRTNRLPAELGISSRIIPKNTKLSINVFKKSPFGDTICRFVYVRLRGLTQFKQYLGWNATCDVVVDFDTDIDPRDSDYPFSTNREGLKAQYQGILEAIRDTMTKAPLSIARDERYKTTLFDNSESFSSSKGEECEELIVTSPTVKKTLIGIQKVFASKPSAGFSAQGGYVSATMLDYIQQSDGNSKNTQSNTKFKKNPLKFSWIIHEDTEYKPGYRYRKASLVSMVTVWDAIVKLMAKNSQKQGIMKPMTLYPGLIFESKVLGMCMNKTIVKGSQSENRCYIMFNPYEIPAGDNLTTALYLMGVAAHELSHSSCGSFEAHGETFSYTREAIMNANLTELTTITQLLQFSRFCKFSKCEKFSNDSFKTKDILSEFKA